MARDAPRSKRRSAPLVPGNVQGEPADAAASDAEPLLADARPESPLFDEEQPLIPNMTREQPGPRSPRTNRFSRHYRQMSRERMLRATCIVLAIALFLSLLLFYLGDNFGLANNKNNQCETSKCLNTASNLLDSMNANADPCNDFYQYACGGWEGKHRIPEDKMRVGTFDKLALANQEFIISMLESPLPSGNSSRHLSPGDSVLFGNLSAIYQSCTNFSAIDEKGAKPLIFANAEIRKILPDDSNYTEALPLALVKIHKLGGNAFINVDVQSDLKNPDRQILVLQPGGLGLPSKEYYQNAEIVNVYTATIAKIFAFALSEDDTDGISSMRDLANGSTSWDRVASSIVEFERLLAAASPSKEEASDIKKVYNVESLATLKKKYPKFAWEDYFKHLFAESGLTMQPKFLDLIVVAWPPYFEVLNSILGHGGSNDAIGFYLRSVAMKSAIPFASQDANKLIQDLRSAIDGTTSSPPRSKQCLAHLDEMMGFATGRLYVLHRFSEESKQSASKIIHLILGEFKQKLDTVDWLEPDVRESAKAKVTDMNLKIGYPEIVANAEKLADYYGYMTASKDDFYGNHLLSNVNQLRKLLIRLKSPTDREEFNMFPHVVNAYYEPTMNEIVFPAGILQAPFFDSELPDHMNYGALGAVVGHELSHAFDVSGRQFDSKGRLVDWWTNKTAEEFTHRAQCFIDQYSGFTVPAPNGTQVHVNGKLTVGENMADNSGILQSWAAWKKLPRGERKSLPGMMNLTDEKIFFLSFAQVWCGKARPEYLLKLINIDPHSPGSVRVQGTLQNNNDFRKTFSCADGTPMNPPNKCVLW